MLLWSTVYTPCCGLSSQGCEHGLEDAEQVVEEGMCRNPGDDETVERGRTTLRERRILGQGCVGPYQE